MDQRKYVGRNETTSEAKFFRKVSLLFSTWPEPLSIKFSLVEAQSCFLTFFLEKGNQV